jgi:hypothetical protein
MIAPDSAEVAARPALSRLRVPRHEASPPQAKTDRDLESGAVPLRQSAYRRHRGHAAQNRANAVRKWLIGRGKIVEGD